MQDTELYFYVYISAYVAFIVRSMRVFNNAYDIAYALESYPQKINTPYR